MLRHGRRSRSKSIDISSHRAVISPALHWLLRYHFVVVVLASEPPHVISNNVHGILTSVDSDKLVKLVQPPVNLRNSKWCSVSSLTLTKYSSDKQRLWSDCAYAQADLRLCWSHIPHCWKYHVTAYLMCGYILGLWSVAYCFKVTMTLTSVFSSRKIVYEAILLNHLRQGVSHTVSRSL